jgi:hypothetical protein
MKTPEEIRKLLDQDPGVTVIRESNPHEVDFFILSFFVFCALVEFLEWLF